MSLFPILMAVAVQVPGVHREAMPGGVSLAVLPTATQPTFRMVFRADLDPGLDASTACLLLEAAVAGAQAGGRPGGAGVELRVTADAAGLTWTLEGRTEALEAAFEALRGLSIRSGLSLGAARAVCGSLARFSPEAVARRHAAEAFEAGLWGRPAGDGRVIPPEILVTRSQGAFSPGRARLAVSGDVDIAVVRRLAWQSLGAWQAATPQAMPGVGPQPMSSRDQRGPGLGAVAEVRLGMRLWEPGAQEAAGRLVGQWLQDAVRRRGGWPVWEGGLDAATGLFVLRAEVPAGQGEAALAQLEAWLDGLGRDGVSRALLDGLRQRWETSERALLQDPSRLIQRLGSGSAWGMGLLAQASGVDPAAFERHRKVCLAREARRTLRLEGAP